MKKRMFTPDFFSDEELVNGVGFAGRLFYLGTWSVAEDSGVFLLSPLSLKMKVFPGDDISAAQLQTYIDKLVEMQKIIPYEHNGKRYGWLKNFHRHQKLDNPSAPTLPIPPWLKWFEGETRRKNHYEVDESTLNQYLSNSCPVHVPDTHRTSPAELKELKEVKEATEVINANGHVPEKDKLPPLEDELNISLENYCQEIEAQMVACGANPGYTANKEAYKCIIQFHEAKVPIDFIRSGIVQAYAKKPDISTFTYCAKIIKDLWQRELLKQTPSEPLQFVAATKEQGNGVDYEFLEKYRVKE